MGKESEKRRLELVKQVAEMGWISSIISVQFVKFLLRPVLLIFPLAQGSVDEPA